MVNLEVAVTAFAESVGYVLGTETGTQIRRVGDVYAIKHQNHILHMYPREFEFRQEFIAIEGDPGAAVRVVRGELMEKHHEHVLYVFSNDVAETLPAMQMLGYQHAWNNALMGVHLDEAVYNPTPGLHVRDVRDTEDLVAYQELTGSAAVAQSLADPDIHSFLCVDDDGRPLGRSQIVTKVSMFGYVSGMFTAPEHRRRGAGTALMNAMHRRARSVGARFCLLVPSRYATEINFYPRFRYEAVAPHAVFVPTISFSS